MSFETKKDSERGKSVQELISESQTQASGARKESMARTKSLLEKISGKQEDGSGRTSISAFSVIDNLNKSLLPRYIMKLEEAKEILDAYESELADVDKKLSKMSAPVRASVGGYAVTEVREELRTTKKKLQYHQEATIKRLIGR